MCPGVVVYVTVLISVTIFRACWSEFTIQFTTAILCFIHQVCLELRTSDLCVK